MIGFAVALVRSSRNELGDGNLLACVGGLRVYPGHGSPGQVTAVGDLPFVVGLDQDRAGQAHSRGGAREYASDVVAALDPLVLGLEGVGRPYLFPARGGKSANTVVSSAVT